MRRLSCLLISLAFAAANPVHAISGIQANAGTDRELHAGVVLDLAGTRPGDHRRTDAQMLLGAAIRLGSGTFAGLSTGFGIERRLGRHGFGLTAEIYLLRELDVDPHLGDVGTDGSVRVGGYAIVASSERMSLVAGADYSFGEESVNGRLGVRMDFVGSGRRNLRN